MGAMVRNGLKEPEIRMFTWSFKRNKNNPIKSALKDFSEKYLKHFMTVEQRKT